MSKGCNSISSPTQTLIDTFCFAEFNRLLQQTRQTAYAFIHIPVEVTQFRCRSFHFIRHRSYY